MRHTVWSILLLTLLCGVCSAATLSVDPAESTCVSGETVDLTVLVGDVSNLGGFDIDLRWNPAVVTLDTEAGNVTIGPLFSGHVNNSAVYTQRGRIRVAAVNATLDGVSGSAPLFTVRLKAVDDTGASSPVNLTVNNYGFLNSTSGEDITVSSITGATITTEKSNVIEARIAVPSNQVITGQESRITASVVNRRGTETSPLDINVSVFDDNGATVQSWNYPGETIPAWGRFQRELTWTPEDAGTYNIRVNVTSGDHVSGTQNYTTTVTAREYTLAFTNDYVYGPWNGRSSVGSWFYMGAYVNASQSGNIRFNITAPDHVEVDGGRNQTRYLYASNWNYVGVRMRSNTPGQIAAGGIKFDIAANGKADSVNGTKILIWIPSIQVSSVNSTSADSDATFDMTYNTLHTNNTYDNVTTITAQSGARGRTLTGLGYLVRYPYGCVEQTTSQMLASLNVKNYYLDRPADRPSDYASIREQANQSVDRGIGVLVNGALRGQHGDGGWSLWGSGASESSSSSYAAYTLARVNESSEDLNRLLADRISTGDSVDLNTVNFEKLVEWFHENPDDQSSGTWTWSAGVCHAWTPTSNTGFVMLIHDMIRTQGNVSEPYATYMTENMQNATRYFVENQAADGHWGGSSDTAMATALGLWGLESYGTPSDDVTQDEIDDAKANAAAWLVENQNDDDGSWNADSYYGWYSNGRKSESTAYAVLALNATGLTADNETISGGVNWLINQYESGGSWGYTWATQAAIDALIHCQPIDISTGTVDVSIDDTPICILTVSATHPKDEYTLDADQMAAMMAKGELKRTISDWSTVKSHQVDVTRSGSGTGTILVSVENAQRAPVSEIDATIKDTGTIQSVGGSAPTPGALVLSENMDLFDEDASQAIFSSVFLTSNPSPLVANESGELTLVVTAGQNVLSPLIEVPIEGFSFANGTITENGAPVSYERLNSSASDDARSIFIEPDHWLSGSTYIYVFDITPTNEGTLDFQLRFRPLYDEQNVTLDGESLNVAGRGNVSVQVTDEDGNQVKATIVLGNLAPVVKSSHTFTSLLADTYSLSVSKEGYINVSTDVNVTANDEYNVTVTMPTDLSTPRLILSHGSGMIGGVTQMPPEQLNALRNENTTYNVTILGNGGELGIALEFPMRYLMNDPVVKVNGVVTDYEFTNGTFEYDTVTKGYSTTNATLVIYNTTAGSNTVEIEFDGGKLGKARKTGEVTSTDAMFILQFVVGSRAGFDTYDYVDVHSRDRQMITSTDAMYVLQKVTGSRDEYYNLNS